MKKALKKSLGMIIVPLLLTGCSLFGEGGSSNQQQYRDPISNFDELMSYLNVSNGIYELTSDIDCGGKSLTPSTKDGAGSRKKLYGNNHKITNFKIEGKENAALIAKAGKFEFYDITFDNITITGTNPAVLVSEAKECIFSGITIGENVIVGDGSSDYTGGIVAKATGNTTIKDCVNKATIKGGDYTGGIVGYLYNSGIESSKNYGDITGYKNSNVGGITGFAKHYKSDSGSPSGMAFSSLENYGKIDGKSSSKVGGITGEIDRGKHFVQNFTEKLSATALKNYGEVKGVNNVGGIIGELYDGIASTNVSYCENSGTVIGQEYVSGIIGFNESNEELASCKNLDNATHDNYIEGTFYVAGISAKATTVTFSENSMKVKLAEGTPKANGNISLNGQFAIGGIVGSTFDKNAKIENCTNSGIVEGYEVANKEYKKATSIGGIVGLYYGGSFKSNTSSGEVNGDVATGGMIGTFVPNNDTSISGCTMTGKVISGSEYAGGLIGYLKGSGSDHKMSTIVNCEINSNNMFGYGDNFGGLIGYADVGTNTLSHYETTKIAETAVKGTIHYKLNADAFVGYNAETSSGKTCVLIDSSVTRDLTIEKMN